MSVFAGYRKKDDTLFALSETQQSRDASGTIQSSNKGNARTVNAIKYFRRPIARR